MPLASMARSPFSCGMAAKIACGPQALGPLESPVEHGGTRAQYAHVVTDFYARDYDEIFGPLPDGNAQGDDVT